MMTQQFYLGQAVLVRTGKPFAHERAVVVTVSLDIKKKIIDYRVMFGSTDRGFYRGVEWVNQGRMVPDLGSRAIGVVDYDRAMGVGGPVFLKSEKRLVRLLDLKIPYQSSLSGTGNTADAVVDVGEMFPVQTTVSNISVPAWLKLALRGGFVLGSNAGGPHGSKSLSRTPQTTSLCDGIRFRDSNS